MECCWVGWFKLNFEFDSISEAGGTSRLLITPWEESGPNITRLKRDRESIEWQVIYLPSLSSLFLCPALLFLTYLIRRRKPFMRDTTSTHTIPIRTQPIELWPPGFVPNLNVALLAKMIAIATEDDATFVVPESSRKRKASGRVQDTLSNKRTRTTRATSARDRQNVGSDDEASDGVLIIDRSNYYPRAELASNFVKAESEVIPALRHVLEIQYVNEAQPPESGCTASANVSGESLVLGDASLHDILLSLSESLSSPKQINIGEVLLGTYRDRFVGMPAEDKTWLLLIPSLAIDAESNDFQSVSASDLLAACRTLQQYGQAHLSASLQVTLHPLVDGLPKFSLQLEIVASVITPAILENLVPKGTLKGI